MHVYNTLFVRCINPLAEAALVVVVSPHPLHLLRVVVPYLLNSLSHSNRFITEDKNIKYIFLLSNGVCVDYIFISNGLILRNDNNVSKVLLRCSVKICVHLQVKEGWFFSVLRFDDVRFVGP